MELSHAVQMDLHRRMVRIRLFEEAAGKLAEAAKLPGFLHLYVGEEAVAAGVCAALNDDDQITSTHTTVTRMDAVAAIAKVTAAPGKRSDLVTALKFALDNVEVEPGTRLYLLHEDNQDDDALWFYELYENDAALKAHMGSEWFAKLGPMIGPLLGRPPELTFVTPIGGKGL